MSKLLNELMDAMRCLPGVGPKSAQRMVFHLLERDRHGGKRLALKIQEGLEKIGHCKKCRTFSETEICQICANPARDQSLLSIVEGPADLLAVEQATGFKGLYYVLMGHLSPLDGIGPEELGLSFLEQRFATESIREVIIATNPTVEGEATAHFIFNLANKHNIKASRIAHGVPLGGELEYVDTGTLSRAFDGRRPIDS